MKTELRLAPHSTLPGHQVIELWHDGQFIGQVCGADGPGVRVLSKHPLAARVIADAVSVAEVTIAPRKAAGQGANGK